MALTAGGMEFFLCSGMPTLFLNIMAIPATFPTMAVYTTETKQFYVFLVLKSHNRALVVRGLMHFGNRYGDDGTRAPDDIA